MISTFRFLNFSIENFIIFSTFLLRTIAIIIWIDILNQNFINKYKKFGLDEKIIEDFYDLAKLMNYYKLFLSLTILFMLIRFFNLIYFVKYISLIIDVLKESKSEILNLFFIQSLVKIFNF